MTRSLRTPVLLAAGSVVSGLLAYLLFALVTRGLGATVAAPVSVLWTIWALAGAAFSFPLQHWITRCVVAGEEGDVRRSAGRVAALVVVVALALGLLAWVARSRLFHRDDAWFPALVVLVVLGSAAVGVLRGGLAGRGRMAAVAGTLVAENALRCVLVGGLLLAGVHDPVAHGLCLVAGSLVAAWPPAWRYGDTGAGQSRPLAFLGGAATGQLAGQGVLTGGAVLVALLGGTPAEVTAMFAALALFRAPYMVVLGVLPQVTQVVTGHVVAGAGEALRRLGRAWLACAVVVVPLAVLVGALAGPALLRAVFGSTVEVSTTTAALVAAGCALALVNVVAMVAALAQDRAAGVAAAWGTALLLGAVTVVVLSGSAAVERAATAFLVTEVAATVALAVVAAAAFRTRPGLPA
jgi:O-antigen/teichoic acid export membrane protein